jgi:hypothetical protein
MCHLVEFDVMLNRTDVSEIKTSYIFRVKK